MNLSKKANFSASAGAEKRPRFPRLKSRGPIEAKGCMHVLRTSKPGFPRLKSRGPIEACFSEQKNHNTRGISTAEKSWPH